MKFHLTVQSSNRKTGPIPVSTSPRETCPGSCALRGHGCYAENFPMSTHWEAVSRGERGVSWEEFLEQIRALPEHQLWRHNQAGDLPGWSDAIDAEMMLQLIDANAGRNGYTYTHKYGSPRNTGLIKLANQSGFTVNLSADSLCSVDKLLAMDVGPVVAVIPKYQKGSSETPGGKRIMVCPAFHDDDMSCARCGKCSRANRDYVIGFPAHGAAAHKITERVMPKLF